VPRNNICLQCAGAFDDEDMADETTCTYCAVGVDSGFEWEEDDDADETQA
jgi:hypothetical protein